MTEQETTIASFPWKSSRTPNCQCLVSLRAGREGTSNLYIDALDADTGNISKGIYFRPHELPEIIAALQKANMILNG